MTTTTSILSAPTSAVPAPADTRRRSATTNLDDHLSPLLDEAQRTAIDSILAVYGAPALRLTGATETVARKALRVALRARGIEAPAAREMATNIVASSRA